MKIYIDTVKIKEIEKVLDTGLISGITTTPTFFARDGYKNPVEFYKKMREVFDGDIQVEALGKSVEGIESSIKEILDSGLTNLTFKTPVTWAGIKTVKQYSSKYKFNVHLVYNVNQAMIAAESGAQIVCPLMGRYDDYGGDSMRLLLDIKETLIANNYDTNVMASSIRHPKHVENAFKAKADIITIPPKVFWSLLETPLTQDGIDKFEKDLESVSL